MNYLEVINVTNCFFDTVSLLTLPLVDFLELLPLLILELLQRLGCIFVFLIDKVINVFNLVFGVVDFRLLALIELLALILGLFFLAGKLLLL